MTRCRGELGFLEHVDRCVLLGKLQIGEKLLFRAAICSVAVLASASCASNAPVRPNLVQIVDKEIAKLAAGPLLKCQRRWGQAIVGHDCIQTFAGADQRYFAALSVQVQRPEGPVPAAASRLVGTSFGPGGGGSEYKGRTRDGAYDVVATEMQSLKEGQQSVLPSATIVIDRVLAAYDATGQQPVRDRTPQRGERR